MAAMSLASSAAAAPFRRRRPCIFPPADRFPSAAIVGARCRPSMGHRAWRRERRCLLHCRRPLGVGVGESLRTTRLSSTDDAASSATTTSGPDVTGDELVLVVGGTGRVGRRVVTRLNALGVRVRVLTRDPDSAAAAELVAACVDTARTLEMVRGDVVADDAAGLRDAVAGCTQVVACFGAQRISKITDALPFTRPDEDDPAHPAAVNYRGVARLAAAAAEAGTVRRFVRVTGMSVGYPPMQIIAVLLNTVLSMTITWQLRGEMAVRDCGVAYTVIRPGSLSDAPRPEGSVVLVGHSGAHVPAGKVSRDDVAELITLATFSPRAENATIGIAGAARPTGGIRSEMSWDPARGMHYRAVEVDETVMEGTDVGDMLQKVAGDVDALEEKNHAPYVAAFVALLAGVGVAAARGALALVGHLFGAA